MTLDQILQQCARNTYNQKVMVRSESGYTGKGLEYAERFLGFINAICQKVARERWAPTVEETVTLNEYGEFPYTALAHPLIRVIRVRDDRTEHAFETDDLGDTYVVGLKSQPVQVMYGYLPDTLTMANLDSQLPFPEAQIPSEVIYDYATFRFLYQEGTDYDTTRAQPFLNTFNDAYAKIMPIAFQRRVK